MMRTKSEKYYGTLRIIIYCQAIISRHESRQVHLKQRRLLDMLIILRLIVVTLAQHRELYQDNNLNAKIKGHASPL